MRDEETEEDRKILEEQLKFMRELEEKKIQPAAKVIKLDEKKETDGNLIILKTSFIIILHLDASNNKETYKIMYHSSDMKYSSVFFRTFNK